jgi:alkylated DNA repair dioxygenase AlkB
VGWISDRRGYRYAPADPRADGVAADAATLRELAARCARMAGFAGFEPDACLVNRYAPGTRLSLHQDRNERDMRAPVVSVSLGLAGAVPVRRPAARRSGAAHSAGAWRRGGLGRPAAPGFPRRRPWPTVSTRSPAAAAST